MSNNLTEHFTNLEIQIKSIDPGILGSSKTSIDIFPSGFSLQAPRILSFSCFLNLFFIPLELILLSRPPKTGIKAMLQEKEKTTTFFSSRTRLDFQIVSNLANLWQKSVKRRYTTQDIKNRASQ